MRFGFVLVALVLCGVSSAVPTDGSSASATSAVVEKSASVVATEAVASAKTPATGKSSASPGNSTDGDEDDDDDDDEDESQYGGGEPGLDIPLSSAILLSSHHGHHVCLPDVVAYSILSSRGYPLGSLFSYHHASSQKLQQQLMFLKAYAKAGQHMWKSISTGHGKHSRAALENFVKFAAKDGHGISSKT